MIRKMKVCVVTSTRAEYGLLKNLIKKLNDDEQIDCKLAVTGAHLTKSFGNTVKEIENDGLPIDAKVDIQMAGDSQVSVCKTMGMAMISFGEYLNRIKPDMLILLGDRYEICAIAAVAVNLRIAIAHLYGGETTEGAVDEAFRHAITKMSYLHFTSTEPYRHRVIQLGEDPSRVYNVGSLGVENIKKIPLMNKEQLEESIGVNFGERLAIGTFHPVTLSGNVIEECKNVLEACRTFHNVVFLFTKANADAGGHQINEILEYYAQENKNIYLVDSLGYKRYLSALKYALFVIGNSSSGIIEVPSFKIPTINIGIRQQGRIQGQSIINVKPEKEDIVKAIESAMHLDCSVYSNPYEGNQTSERIFTNIKEHLKRGKIDIVKKFYDINLQEGK